MRSKQGRKQSKHALYSEIHKLEPRRLLSAVNGFNGCGLGELDGTPIPAELSPPLDSVPVGSAATSPLSSVPALHSNLGAKALIYLDFIGASAQTWGSYSVPATPAFDQDGDPTTFSSGELAAVQEIWARVSEKYTPFNVDVTTVAPSSLVHKQNLEVVIGGNGSWTGLPYSGLSYVSAFSSPFSPNLSWVFSTALYNNPTYVAEASAHEAGHEFGLYHQSLYSGTTLVNEYNPGNSLTAPIMGNSYSAQRGLWWNGPNDISSTTMQDDMAIIANATNGFGYRAQDHGQSIATANPLSISGNSISGSGIIARTTDSDFFSFTTPSGSVTFNLNVAPFGPTLHGKLQLFNASGSLIASANNAATLGQTLTTTLAAGTYYLSVNSYGQYGDVGQYSLSGSVATTSSSTFTISGPATINESASYALSLSATDPGQTIASWAIDWGDGSPIQTVAGNPTSTSHAYSAGPNSYTISATATDGTGTYPSNTQLVGVLHVAPIASISGPATVFELATYSLGLGVSDPNHSILSWAINWGDGSAVQTIAGNPSSATHIFANGPHSYTISATVTDDVGTYSAAGATVVGVQHVPPVASVSGTSTVNELTPYTLSLAVSDPSHAILSWAINWGDGTPGQTLTENPSSVAHTFAAGPHLYTISAMVTDDIGTYSAANSQVVSILHVAPALTISGLTTVIAVAPYTLHLSSIDPGHTVSFCSINWGDGSTVQNVPGNPASVTHTYASGPSNCTISATATDDVGTFNAASTVVVSVQPVNNSPVFSISGGASVNEQSPYSLNLTASDPGHAITSWAINWGDGTVVQILQGNPTSVSHVYSSGPNHYTITANATDDVTTYPAGNSQAISVIKVPPIVTISGTSFETLPTPYTLNLSVQDPGHAIAGWTINWGDGSPAQMVSNVSSIAHVFAAGEYQIAATVTDDVGTFGSNGLTVNVNPAADAIAPTATASLGNVELTNTFTVTYTDNVLIDAATLGTSNILVTGPNGFNQLATLMAISSSTDSAVITATYAITPPGGTWDYTALGNYSVVMQENSITDVAGNAVAAGSLGSFNIIVAPPSLPNKGHHSKRGTLAEAAPTYVSFAPTAPTTVMVRLASQLPGITLELLDSDYNVVASRSGKKAVSFAETLNGGTYYLRISYAGSRATSYTVGITAKPLTAAQRVKFAAL